MTEPGAPAVPGYEMLGILGQGGFGVVYRARQLAVRREVALKVDNRVLVSERDRRRFMREVSSAGALSGHPHVADVYDAGVLPDGRPYMVLELCPGGSLADRLRERGPLPPAEVRDIGVRIADALAAAHAAGVLHRDVKPANILINQYGMVALSDFGLAATGHAEGEVSVTRESLTPAFGPPEAFELAEPSPAGDVYSLAATLYALLNGRPPRFPESGVVNVAMIMALHRLPVPEIPGVPPRLTAVLRTGLATHPHDRLPSAAALRDALTALPAEIFSQPPTTTPPPPAGPHTHPSSGPYTPASPSSGPAGPYAFPHTAFPPDATGPGHAADVTGPSGHGRHSRHRDAGPLEATGPGSGHGHDPGGGLGYGPGGGLGYGPGGGHGHDPGGGLGYGPGGGHRYDPGSGHGYGPGGSPANATPGGQLGAGPGGRPGGAPAAPGGFISAPRTPGGLSAPGIPIAPGTPIGPGTPNGPGAPIVSPGVPNGPGAPNGPISGPGNPGSGTGAPGGLRSRPGGGPGGPGGAAGPAGGGRVPGGWGGGAEPGLRGQVTGPSVRGDGRPGARSRAAGPGGRADITQPPVPPVARPRQTKLYGTVAALFAVLLVVGVTVAWFESREPVTGPSGSPGATGAPGQAAGPSGDAGAGTGDGQADAPGTLGGVPVVTENCPATVVTGAGAACGRDPECWGGIVAITGAVSVRRRACEESHVWETFAIAPLPQDAMTFDLADLEAHPVVKKLCSSQVMLRSRIGAARSVPSSQWMVSVLPPSPDAFKEGVRIYRCVGGVTGRERPGTYFRPAT
ncbi:serine/threonine-protein kinase [Sphaerisporangium sp. B11E5]|uniref:serine/threonine-protein kinase n=1 Tax=Sphaerisporangium sp. B11E5 TaxID=3153563 RepID=UPI00325E41DA